MSPSAISYREWGDPEAPVVVLLHGIGSGADSWTHIAGDLAGMRVLAWDMPGYGTSAPLSLQWPDATDYAQALLAWLTSLGTDRFHLVGHSLGALIAARFARLYPTHISALTLASPALGHRVAPPDLSPAVTERLASFAHEGAEAFAARRAPRLLARPTEATLAAVQAQMAKLTPEGHTAAARLLSGGDALGDVAQLTVPMSVIVGGQDQITPPDAARQCHTACPRANRGAFCLVPGAGHALATEVPKAVAAEILIEINQTGGRNV